MGLLDEVHTEPPKKWTRPRVDDFLGPDEAGELAAMLADPSVCANAIHRALRRRGIGVSESAVQKWAYQARHL